MQGRPSHTIFNFFKRRPLPDFELGTISTKCNKFIAEAAEITEKVPEWDFVIGTFLGYLQGADLVKE